MHKGIGLHFSVHNCSPACLCTCVSACVQVTYLDALINNSCLEMVQVVIYSFKNDSLEKTKKRANARKQFRPLITPRNEDNVVHKNYYDGCRQSGSG